LVELKKKFGRENNKLTKVAEIKQVKLDSYTIDKFVQVFKHIVKSSRYKKQTLIKKFKRDMNSAIRQKLMETEYLSKSIEQ